LAHSLFCRCRGSNPKPAGASRCAVGFFAAKGSLKACTRCPEGRTTADDPAQQEYIGQCIVDVGFGLAASIVAGNLPENITQVAQGALPASTISAADMQQINTDQCPTGFYGGGGSLLSTCVRCPGYFTTEGPGKTSDADCNGKSTWYLIITEVWHCRLKKQRSNR
jgi:hypothetical protein